jgi:hypothetical protein
MFEICDLTDNQWLSPIAPLFFNLLLGLALAGDQSNEQS